MMPLTIDIYRMSDEQTIEMIERLRKEVQWGKFELLQMVREWAIGYWNVSLDDALTDLAARGMLGKLWWYLIEKAPFNIRLDNLDDEEGGVMIDCESQILATHDQSVAGSHWECPSDMDIAYACAGDHPGLVEELTKEGYIVNDDNYWPPDWDPPPKEEDDGKTMDTSGGS
jgi:hypothetical protein